MVEVTQEDREAAASIAVLVEMRELIREGRADHHAEPFARHRVAAENAAMERAAKVATSIYCEGDWLDRNLAAEAISTAIRALKGPSNAD